MTLTRFEAKWTIKKVPTQCSTRKHLLASTHVVPPLQRCAPRCRTRSDFRVEEEELQRDSSGLHALEAELLSDPNAELPHPFLHPHPGRCRVGAESALLRELDDAWRVLLVFVSLNVRPLLAIPRMRAEKPKTVRMNCDIRCQIVPPQPKRPNAILPRLPTHLQNK